MTFAGILLTKALYSPQRERVYMNVAEILSQVQYLHIRKGMWYVCSAHISKRNQKQRRTINNVYFYEYSFNLRIQNVTNQFYVLEPKMHYACCL